MIGTLATINYTQRPATPTGSPVAVPDTPAFVTQGAPMGSSGVTYAYGNALTQGGVGTVERAAAAGLVPAGTSTSAAGWVGPSPLNTVTTPAELAAVAPGSAPPAEPVIMTPFRRIMNAMIPIALHPPAKNEWAVENDGSHADFPGPQAATPPGAALPFQQRSNSFRLQPQPWDANVYIGQTGQAGSLEAN